MDILPIERSNKISSQLCIYLMCQPVIDVLLVLQSVDQLFPPVEINFRNHRLQRFSHRVYIIRYCFKERIEDPTKTYKYNENDFKEAELWDDYRHMYEDVFENCSAVPWTIVPADQNWFKEHTIAKTLVNGLRKLDMKYPQLEK